MQRSGTGMSRLSGVGVGCGGLHRGVASIEMRREESMEGFVYMAFSRMRLDE